MRKYKGGFETRPYNIQNGDVPVGAGFKPALNKPVLNKPAPTKNHGLPEIVRKENRDNSDRFRVMFT